MIKQEEAQAFIAGRKRKRLKASDFTQFSTKYQTLADIIARWKKQTNVHGYHYDMYNIEYYLKPYKKHFGEDPLTNPWATNEGLKVAKLLFGEEQGAYIPALWDLFNTTPYQEGYARRSFRMKPNDIHTQNKISHLQSLFQRGETGVDQLTMLELAQYDVYDNNFNFRDNSYLFAAALNTKEKSPALQALVKDIFLGEDEIGGVTRGLVKGLLLSNDRENWVLVKDLLLAAQREEGLRQTILECLDETNVGALHFLIEVILEHNLMRFSSVVRAVDTWFGFGWDAPKKATIKRVLTISLSLFEDADLVTKYLRGKDNLEVYIALWFLALRDVDEAVLQALELVKNEKKEKQILAAMFIVETQRTNKKIVPWIKENIGEDLELDYWLLAILPADQRIDQVFFEKILALAKSTPPKGKKVDGYVFSWTVFSINPPYFYRKLIEVANANQIMQLAEHLDKIPSEEREALVRKIFPKHAQNIYSYAIPKVMPKIDLKKEAWKRDLAFLAIKDRNETVMRIGISIVEHLDLTKTDLAFLQDLLSRKKQVLRLRIVQMLLKQKDEVIQPVISELLEAPKAEQRLAGLEMLSILFEENRLADFVNQKVKAFAGRSKISKNEQVYLDKCMAKEQAFSFANGFGAIDYSNLRSIYQPELKFGKEKKSMLKKVLSKLSAKNNFLFSNLIDIDKTVKAINELIALFEEHKNHEYLVTYYNGTKETKLLGNSVEPIRQKKDKEEIEQIDLLPLAEVWKSWYQKSKLSDFEMMAGIFYSNNFVNVFGNGPETINFNKHYIPDLFGLNLDQYNHWDSKNRKIYTILFYLNEAYIDRKMMVQFKVDVLEDMIARLPDLFKKEPHENPNYRPPAHWTGIMSTLGMGGNQLHAEIQSPEIGLDTLTQYWDLQNYLLYTLVGAPGSDAFMKEIAGRDQYRRRATHPSAWLTIKLFNEGVLNADDFRYQCLIDYSLLQTLERKIHHRSRNSFSEEELPKTVTKELKKNLLTVELERGDLKTEASPYVTYFQQIEGSHYLFNLLERLGKENFHRGYYWGEGSSKKAAFSNLIKKCVPGKEEDVSTFFNLAKSSKLTKKRFLETAMYAPQWASRVEEFLGVEKLNDAIWWFHAHSSSYMDSEKETLISRYSSIDKEDFQRGAIDINWFNEAYSKTGKQNWKLLHDAAKYITDGNGHRQVKLYSGVMLGEIKIRETLAKIKDKRDKDYVRALGLIPLSKKNPDKDLLSRYDLLQKFLKESKQFGAQRQESEKNAVNIALDNLARNAGYEDSLRFSWAMEGEATQKIMEKATVVLDNVSLQLVVNKNGKAEIEVTKDGKSQKSIPAKYKKDKGVLALQKNRTYLRKQFSRTRLSLENAMLREDEFTIEEVGKIWLHPVVRAMLSKLVLFDKENKRSGFWTDEGLISIDGKKVKVSAKDKFVIAHPVHLYESVEWDLYQKFAFDEKLVQPFKQIFRELYLITKDEQEVGTRSERYQGHQIQPKKTVALLRSKGWTVSHEEGLQKVYHKKGFIATMYAMADWFSPADIEAPTLEYVAFHYRNNYQPVPLDKVDPVIFSEIMRDVDLVVSVAHVGGVDPEASHSTMQMRAALARESARLFKLENVTVQERHVIIKGKLADYSLHLGSGGVHKNGLRLSIIPVHSQHRGRLFLPFIDEDPKSAEIISKMKLLAEDNKIKDPTILSQINR